MKSTLSRNSELIKAEAHRLGFMLCGISRAEFLEDEAPRLERWLMAGHHGKMGYMENHFDKRLDPRKLVEGARSVISLAYNYYTPETQTDPTAPKISKYAYGEDYHDVVKSKLAELFEFILDNIGDVGGRMFVDSAPVLERAWAQRSGLGWIGKNANMLNKQSGSFFFLAEMIIDLDLEYDHPLVKDYCGKCTRCIDACPTNAIIDNKLVDGSKCISYLTIELKDDIPEEFQNKMDNWMFGCDVCQDVCPWNRFSTPHEEKSFLPNPQLMEMSQSDWDDITEDIFKALFRRSPVKRTKFKGLSRNLKFLKTDVYAGL